MIQLNTADLLFYSYILMSDSIAPHVSAFKKLSEKQRMGLIVSILIDCDRIIMTSADPIHIENAKYIKGIISDTNKLLNLLTILIYEQDFYKGTPMYFTHTYDYWEKILSKIN